MRARQTRFPVVFMLVTLLLCHSPIPRHGRTWHFGTSAALAFTTSNSSSTTAAAAATHNKEAAIPSSSSNNVLSLDLNDPSNDDASRNSNKDAYHLLWSPMAWSKFLYTTAALILMPRILGLFSPSLSLPAWLSSSTRHSSSSLSFMASAWNNLVLPLVASSCCLIQLVLNALAVGCGGFNKILGPVRPFFLAWLVVASLQRPLPSPWTLAGRFTVAFLPEGLDAFNHYNHQRILRQSEQNPDVAADGGTMVDVVTMEIPTMGCSACVHAVNEALNSLPNIVSASAQLHPIGFKKGGSALIRVVKSQEEGYQDLIDAVEWAGFNDVTIDKDSIESKQV